MTDPKGLANLVDELAEDFARRLRAGATPAIDEYCSRHPEAADEIRAALTAVAIMERLKPQRDQAAPTQPAAPLFGPPPERIGEYRIIREIGRGGMGVVYEAEQETLGRRVAIKVLPGHLLPNEKLRSRFRREAQAAARLHHTNIVPVFGVGEGEGADQCYYVMQQIDGKGLDKIERSAESPQAFVRGVARIGLQVAEALAYAHKQGVLHRDIKPSNLLLDSKDTVWITDFGVAKVLEESNLTQSGDIIGTLKYMPPERFAGVSDARGDVYSLGVTLYELLTLRPAFPDTTPQHLIQLITQTSPVPPRKLNPDIPTDLETIVLKAAAREPAQRYQTPTALADDLRRFLNDRPIAAKRTGPAEHVLRWCRRNPALAGACGAAVLLMVAVTAVSFAAYWHTAAVNKEITNALGAEKLQRDRAESTAALALDALNRTFDRFAPSRLVVAPPTSGEIGVELPPPPTLTPEAVSLLNDLLQTYEQVAVSGAEFPKLRGEVAEANHRLGDIRRRLGRFDDAVSAYRTAIDLYEQLLTQASDDRVRVKLARAYNESGRALCALQQYDDSREKHQNAIRILTASSKDFADRPECRYELACSYFALGARDSSYMFKSAPEPPSSKDDWGGGPPKKGKNKSQGGPPPKLKLDNSSKQAIVLLARLSEEFPAVPEYRHLLACCYRDLPPVWEPQSTRPGPDRAVELLRKLMADYPRIPDYRHDLCETLGRGGPDMKKGGTSADRQLREAIDLSTELVALYPNVPEYTAAHARYLDRLGMSLQKQGKPADAEPLNRKAVALQTKLVTQYPGVLVHTLWLGLMERSLGQTLSDLKQFKEARTMLEGCINRVEPLWKKDRKLDGLRPFLSMAYGNLAQLNDRTEEPIMAAAARAKAAELQSKKGPPAERQ
jgi:eukaryotic-like serine/threonine-protein kinase